MNKLSTRLLTAALAVGVIGSAAAQDYGYTRYDDYRDRGYASGTYEYARVVRADPIMVQVNGPRETTERCYDRPASGSYASDYGYRGTDGGRTASSVVGGIAGAVLGSRVGGGNGRFVGTAVGTMLGSLAGRSIYDTNTRAYGGGYGGAVVRECDPVSYRTERYDRVDGYDVTYEYGGRYYHTRTASPPGDRIRVRVDVLPD
ncbi:membrane protein [Xanthomonas sp. NCPPB 1128]|uniref:glycine zipper 2TM domain-containing protein n=1 Tax=Xanthomonas sp. NCPPB 1128 TaxID=1775876 RepID=UPI00065AF55D|nr:glycine zipper 2TM domain-containing protein [Xanthomonas sp. NCPPB 1128]KMM76833.1 membrane protein [Xanthomonas sp. NCPPB 1128]